ncbi:MAG: phosphopantothenoylcysteine decarboxylase [Planctomycetota bacterium]
MHSSKSGRRLNFLITAGGTREYIDPVRFISNASSGRMGYELARAVAAAGHNVTLITTVEKSKIKNQKSKLRTVEVETAGEMFEDVKKHFPGCDCLIMAGAVSDYTPVRKSKVKIKKSKNDLVIRLKPTIDILNWAVKNRKKKQVVIGFALEDKNVRSNAERKMRQKNLDMIVANTPAAIGAERAEVLVKTAGKDWIKIARAPKRVVARRLIAMIQSLMPKSSLVNSDSNL